MAFSTHKFSLYSMFIFSFIIILFYIFGSFLLFHVIAELFSIFVAFLIGIISYYTYNFTQNRYLLFLGLGYVWIAFLDLMHTLSFPNMNLFDTNDVNVTLSIWTLTRVFEALILLFALLMRSKKFNSSLLFYLFACISLLIIVLSFNSPLSMFIKESGLTPLKNGLEYLAMAVLFSTFMLNRKNKNFFNPQIYYGLQAAIVLTFFAEFSFTTYIIWDGSPAVLGHLLKFMSFWMIFQSLIVTSFIQPMNLLAKDTSTFNAIPIDVTLVDSNGTIKQVNNNVCKSLQMEAEDIIDKSNHELFHSNSISYEECALCNAIAFKEELENYELFDEETHKYYLFSTTKLGSYGMVQVRKDITNNKRLEIEKNNQLQINEKIYKDLFELHESIILLINPIDGKIINANESAVKFYGYSKEEFQALNISDINTLSNKEIKEKMEKVKNNSHDNYYFHFIHKLANKELKNVRVYSKPSIFNNQKVLFSTIVDITDEIEEQKKHERMQRDYEYLFNNTEVSIWNEDLSEIYHTFKRLREEGIEDLKNYIKQHPDFITNMAKSIKILNVNDTTLNMFEAKSFNEFAESIELTFADGAQKVFEQELLSIWNQEHKFNAEANFRTIKGNKIVGNVSFFIPKEEKDFQSIPVTIVDITEKKEKDKLILLQSRHAAMGEMISMIAHQWRQPLTTISMIANNQLLDVELDDVKSDDIKKNSTSILEQTKHLSSTIDDFRNFLNNNTPKEHCTVKKIMDTLLNLIENSYKSHSIDLKVNIQSQTTVFIQQRELIQVLINVLNNSKDAILENNIENPFVKIDIYEDQFNIHIDILDNAGGIKEAFLPKIFDPYFTTKNKQNGTGLGLYMSKIIVEQHLYGKITAKNSENGVLFKIVFSKNES